MVSKQDTTRRWVTRFCDLMDWFLNVDKIHGGNLNAAHVKGLAANFLAVKLGIFDEKKPKEGLDHFEWELPFRRNDWECDNPGTTSCRERREYRRVRMAHWRNKAQENGRFKPTRIQKQVTQGKVRRFCDRLQDIKYRVKADPSMADITDLALDANDLAAELGLTHPDWILAMNLGLLSLQKEEPLRSLPLPHKHAKPPIVFNGCRAIAGTFGHAAIDGLDEWIRKAESLLPATTESTEVIPALRRLENPVRCTKVAGIIHRRSDNVASTLKRHRYPVIVEGRKSYCDADDAAVLWPKWRKYWEEKKNSR